MSKILYLVRHAEAVKNQPHKEDVDRELTEQGQQDADQLGIYFKKTSPVINLIITSLTIRSISTGVRIAKQIGYTNREIEMDKLINSCDSMYLLKLINNLAESFEKVLLVGHYPTLVEFHNYLSANKSIASMNTAELCVLKFEMPWSEISKSSGRHELSYHPHFDDMR